jgi:hypothetical protein
MATSTARPRTAQLVIQKGRAGATVTAYCPTKVTGKEFAALNEIVINKVIKDLTGCPCLSGLVDVLYHDDLNKSINIDLASGQIG